MKTSEPILVYGTMTEKGKRFHLPHPELLQDDYHAETACGMKLEPTGEDEFNFWSMTRDSLARIICKTCRWVDPTIGQVCAMKEWPVNYTQIHTVPRSAEGEVKVAEPMTEQRFMRYMEAAQQASFFHPKRDSSGFGTGGFGPVMRPTELEIGRCPDCSFGSGPCRKHRKKE